MGYIFGIFATAYDLTLDIFGKLFIKSIRIMIKSLK